MKKSIVSTILLASLCCFSQCTFSLTSCTKNNPQEINPIVIPPSDPQQTTQTITLNSGYSEFIIKGFTYQNIDIVDPDLFLCFAPGIGQYAKEIKGSFKTSITNLDKAKKEFDVQIIVEEFLPTPSAIITAFGFEYDSKKIEVQNRDFNFNFVGEGSDKEIFCPTTKEYDVNLYSTTFELTIPGFTFKGIKNVEDIKIDTDLPGDGQIFTTKIVYDPGAPRSFNILITGANIILNTTSFNFSFSINDKPIKCKTPTFKITFHIDPDVPNFVTDSWANICKYARLGGYKKLQEVYKVKSFLGVNKNISLKKGVTDAYSLRVIGEQQDELYNKLSPEGEKASLSFIFENAITISSTNAGNKAKLDIFNSNGKNYWIDSSTETGSFYMREWLNNEFKNNWLPYELSPYICEVKKKTAFSTTKTIVESRDFLWLPSIVELGGVPLKDEEVFLKEGECYQYFSGINHNNRNVKRIRKCLGGSAEESFWLRTPSLTNETSLHGCELGGIVGSERYYDAKGTIHAIVPCFSI